MELPPKEKAEELVMEFQHLVTSWDCYNDEPLELEYMMGDMKKCALICINESIKERQILNNNFDRERIKELLEMKQELNKL